MGYFELERIVSSKEDCFKTNDGECVVAWTKNVALVYRLGRPSASAAMLYLVGITITPEWNYEAEAVSTDALIRLKYWPIRFAKGKNEIVLLYDAFLKELNAKEIRRNGKIYLSLKGQLHEVDESVVKSEMALIEKLKAHEEFFEQPINYLFRKTEELNERLATKAKRGLSIPFKL